MKLKNIKNIINYFAILLIFAILSACGNQKDHNYPEITSATYSPYNLQGERGYFVEFEISSDSVLPTAVVINRVKKDISPADRTGLHFRINVIAQTRKIHNYRIEGSEKPNGIYFKNRKKEHFKAIEFNLK